VGKTRLALALARTVADDFTDGATFVDHLASRRPKQVLMVVAHALGLREAGRR
jgi:predicted ATPase